MGILNKVLTVAEFVVTKSNPVAGAGIGIAKYLFNKTKETPKMMNGFKTYIGIAVAVAPTLASLFGYEMTIEGQETLSANLNEIAVMIGGMIAAYGRFKAKPIATKKS